MIKKIIFHTILYSIFCNVNASDLKQSNQEKINTLRNELSSINQEHADYLRFLRFKITVLPSFLLDRDQIYTELSDKKWTYWKNITDIINEIAKLEK